MQFIHSATAILLFSRTPQGEATAKTFDHRLDTKANAAIARHLIKHSELAAKATGLPLFTCYDRGQQGDNFGLRLADAIEMVFEAGFERVIAIGNDCPEVTTALLNETAEKLISSPLILGPAIDGGVYLIGINKCVYQRDAFINLSWENQYLQYSWSNSYEPLLRAPILWLDQLSDIDDASDLKKVIATLPHWHVLRRKLLQLTFFPKPTFYTTLSYSSKLHFFDAPMRAPPVFI